MAKANEVPPAVEKAVKDAKKNLHQVPVVDDTIPHPVIGKCRATQVTMLPASPGTGVIAGASARAVLEYAGRAKRADQDQRQPLGQECGQGGHGRVC